MTDEMWALMERTSREHTARRARLSPALNAARDKVETAIAHLHTMRLWTWPPKGLAHDGSWDDTVKIDAAEDSCLSMLARAEEALADYRRCLRAALTERAP